MLNLSSHYVKHSFTIRNTFQHCATGIQPGDGSSRRIPGVSVTASSRADAAATNAHSKACGTSSRLHIKARSQTICRLRKRRPLSWTIPLPEWCADQRNQMTGPADDAELVVKMLNSGAPGVMLDLEDSMANTWSNLTTGIANIDAALKGELTYFDAKRNRDVGINRQQDSHLHSTARLAHQPGRSRQRRVDVSFTVRRGDGCLPS